MRPTYETQKCVFYQTSVCIKNQNYFLCHPPWQQEQEQQQQQQEELRAMAAMAGDAEALGPGAPRRQPQLLARA